MGRFFTSGLLAGVVAAVIWMAAGLWVGLPPEAVGMWALVFLVGTALLTILGATLGSRAGDAVSARTTAGS
ncbi:hypothetical protein [Agrococcus casei]|uniref:hypothetical protein n=1 Tax=Agrococcus casei TaxID=343512 RepID=UPI003F9244A4